MNCETIDSILDDRRGARLSPAERQYFAAHLEQCGRCAGASAAHDALAGEKLADPPPELFARVLAQVVAARAGTQAVHGRRRALAVAAAAGVAVLALLAGYAALDLGPDDAGRTSAIRESTPAAAGSTRTGFRAFIGWPPATERLWRRLKGSTVTRPAPAVSPPRFVAGRDYEVLTGATPLAATADGVPVTEFFMFLCFPCYAVEPALEEFRTASLGRAAVTRVPVVFNADAELHARAFFAAEALGKLDAMHAAFYDQIHVRGNRLASRAALAEFFARFGVNAAAFDAAFDSSAVDASVRRAVALSREYGIEAVPTVVVGGRYATSPSLAGSSFVAVVEQLVAEAACTTRCDSAQPLSTEGELRRVEQSREGEPR